MFWKAGEPVQSPLAQWSHSGISPVQPQSRVLPMRVSPGTRTKSQSWGLREAKEGSSDLALNALLSPGGLKDDVLSAFRPTLLASRACCSLLRPSDSSRTELISRDLERRRMGDRGGRGLCTLPCPGRCCPPSLCGACMDTAVSPCETAVRWVNFPAPQHLKNSVHFVLILG